LATKQPKSLPNAHHLAHVKFASFTCTYCRALPNESHPQGQGIWHLAASDLLALMHGCRLLVISAWSIQVCAAMLIPAVPGALTAPEVVAEVAASGQTTVGIVGFGMYIRMYMDIHIHIHIHMYTYEY